MPKSVISIVTKVIIVGLVALMIYVIQFQGQIRIDENEALDTSRIRLETLAEALEYYAQKNKRYTTDFDTLLTFIKNDSTLNEKHQIVLLSNELINAINDVKAVPALNRLLGIRRSLNEVRSILDEVNDSYKSVPSIATKNMELYEGIKSFMLDDRYEMMNVALSLVDTLDLISIEISDYTLQNAAERSLTYIDSIQTVLSSIEVDGFTARWNEIRDDLVQLSLMIKAGEKQQNLTNRYLKHTEIADKHVIALNQMDLSTQASLLASRRSEVVAVRDKFLNDHFTLSTHYGIQSLEREEELLVAMDENTIHAPPLDGKRFKIEVINNGFGYTVTCPNSEGEFSRGLFTQRYINYGSISNGEKSWEQ